MNNNVLCQIKMKYYINVILQMYTDYFIYTNNFILLQYKK